MKPDWKDAPAWANYLAMDLDGTWYWYETKPEVHSPCSESWSIGYGNCAEAGETKWDDTLEERPK